MKDPLLMTGITSEKRLRKEGSAFSLKGMIRAKRLSNRPALATFTDLEEHYQNRFFYVDPTVRC